MSQPHFSDTPLPIEAIQPYSHITPPPIVIIGNGPVGMHAARELLRRNRDANIVIYGNEHHQPYNRVKLSYLLSGELDWDSLLEKLQIPETATVDERIGLKITYINAEERFIEDHLGVRQPYNKLILATGSSPYIPNIPGIKNEGVFTFRNLDDANLLIARRVRSQHTVILGGGLLGLEAARGMQRNNTQVTVVEHADRLLSHQLDIDASTTLRSHLRKLGIRTVIDNGVSEIFGEPRISAVILRTGRIIDCDTIIVATGIRPNIDLAIDAGLAYGRGIKVDDNMMSSKSDIYAIGECAEHRNTVYGIVAPGLEQAGVAVNHILGQESLYQGSITAASLKVAGCHVFSIGPVGETASPNYGKSYSYSNTDEGIYRKLLIHRNRLVGVIAVGDWPQSQRVQSCATENRLIWPWQLLRFAYTGNLWPEEETTNVSAWPTSAIVCQCAGITRGRIGESIREGALTVSEVAKATGATSVCRSCRPLIQELVGAGKPDPATWYKTLGLTSLVSIIAALAILTSPNIPFSSTVQVDWRWDELWRNSLFKQISGFTVLGLFSLGLLVSPRKRVKKWQRIGRFDVWRLMHIFMGVLVIAGLIVHTGMRLGHGLNFILMLTFTITLVLGALATGTISLEHRLGANATWIRRKTTWWHILFFWPVPVVLCLHILKTYYF